LNLSCSNYRYLTNNVIAIAENKPFEKITRVSIRADGLLWALAAMGCLGRLFLDEQPGDDRDRLRFSGISLGIARPFNRPAASFALRGEPLLLQKSALIGVICG
jgi:hypothetical protein